MNTKGSLFSKASASWACVLTMATAAALLLALSPAGGAQSGEIQPAALSKQRTTLYLQATRAPLADMENDVNHLALLSETCRAEYGGQACGLPDKPLESSTLEERYAYYVKGPIEAHSRKPGVKIDRRNWAAPSPPASSK